MRRLLIRGRAADWRDGGKEGERERGSRCERRRWFIYDFFRISVRLLMVLLHLLSWGREEGREGGGEGRWRNDRHPTWTQLSCGGDEGGRERGREGGREGGREEHPSNIFPLFLVSDPLFRVFSHKTL